MGAQTTWVACFYRYSGKSMARTLRWANMLPLEGGNMPPEREIGESWLDWRSLPNKRAHPSRGNRPGSGLPVFFRQFGPQPQPQHQHSSAQAAAYSQALGFQTPPGAPTGRSSARATHAFFIVRFTRSRENGTPPDVRQGVGLWLSRWLRGARAMADEMGQVTVVSRGGAEQRIELNQMSCAQVQWRTESR